MFRKTFALPAALSFTATIGLIGAVSLMSACSGEGEPKPTPTIPPKYSHVEITGDGAFGDLVAGAEPVTRTFTVTNTGEIDATLGVITSAGLGLSGPFVHTGGTCASGQTLQAFAEDSCTIKITFAPSDAKQTTLAVTVKFQDESDLAEQTAETVVSGTGKLDCENHNVPACPKPAPALSLSNGPKFDFGTVIVSTDASHTFTLTNTGNADAVLGAVTPGAIGLPAPYTLVSGGQDACVTGGVVAKDGGTCKITVNYAPSAPVVSSATIRVSFSGQNLPHDEAVRTLTGKGELECENHYVDLCPPALPKIVFTDAVSSDFGNVNIGSTSSKSATFTLTNQGQVDGKLKPINDASIGIALPFTVTGGTCVSGSDLTLKAKGGFCTLTITLTPQKPGAEEQTLSVRYSGENGDSLVTRAVYGVSVLTCSADPTLKGFYDQGVSVATTDNANQTQQGTVAGKAASYKTGYNDGYAATYQGVYNAAYQAAYTQVYNSNYTGWYNTAYNAACPGATTTGKADGIAAGTDAGNYDGYHTGYYDGYTSAYDDGYNTGYDAAVDSTCGNFAPEADFFKARIAQIAVARASGGTAGPVARAPDPAQDPSNDQACYNQGYIATYKADSYQTAFNKAVKATDSDYAAGKTAGTNQADTDAKAKATPAGTTDGTKAAQDEGTSKGTGNALNECYASAYNSNYTSSYKTAYNSTYPTGSADGDVDGTGTGYTDGFQQGVADCSGNGAPARHLPRGTDVASPGLAPTLYFQKSYGLDQPWVAQGPNGVLVDLFVQKPMLRGVSVVELNRDLRNEALKSLKSVTVPAMRVLILNRHRAGQTTLK